jgi:hypothetical protein
MQDAFKQLSAQQLARLIQYAEAGDDAAPDGAQLHAEKNAPWVNGAYTHLRFPPYEFRPYPKCLYTSAYLRAQEQYLQAKARRVRPGDEGDYFVRLQETEAARNATMRIVESPDEEAALGPGWAETPGKAVEQQETLDRAVAQAAAESAWDDRRLGALAQAERATADEQSPEHLVEVPRTPVKPKK